MRDYISHCAVVHLPGSNKREESWSHRKEDNDLTASTKYGRYIITNPIPHPSIKTWLITCNGTTEDTRKDERGREKGNSLPQADLPECQMRCVVARQVSIP